MSCHSHEPRRFTEEEIAEWRLSRQCQPIKPFVRFNSQQKQSVLTEHLFSSSVDISQQVTPSGNPIPQQAGLPSPVEADIELDSYGYFHYTRIVDNACWYAQGCCGIVECPLRRRGR